MSVCGLRYVYIPIVLAALTGEVFAQQQAAPTDGTTCFCLQHDDSLKQVIYNCTGFRPPKATEVTALCKGEDPTAKPSKFTVAPPWTVILKDQDGCRPCERERATIKVPRNELEDK